MSLHDASGCWESRRPPDDRMDAENGDEIVQKLLVLLSATKTTVTSTFRRLDRDNSGALDEQEFGQLLSGMGILLDQTQLTQLFGAFDKDGGGEIDLLEFSTHLDEAKAARAKKKRLERSGRAPGQRRPPYELPPHPMLEGLTINFGEEEESHEDDEDDEDNDSSGALGAMTAPAIVWHRPERSFGNTFQRRMAVPDVIAVPRSALGRTQKVVRHESAADLRMKQCARESRARLSVSQARHASIYEADAASISSRRRDPFAGHSRPTSASTSQPGSPKQNSLATWHSGISPPSAYPPRPN